MAINTIKFDEKGLIPAIVQDAVSGEVVMFAWMNRESFKKTLDTGVMTYWSRSRQKLWIKGETSGNTQNVNEIYIDCDADCLLFKVEPQGLGAACHEGYRSCFFRKVSHPEGNLTRVAERVFDPVEVYKNNNKASGEKTATPK